MNCERRTLSVTERRCRRAAKAARRFSVRRKRVGKAFRRRRRRRRKGGFRRAAGEQERKPAGGAAQGVECSPKAEGFFDSFGFASDSQPKYRFQK